MRPSRRMRRILLWLAVALAAVVAAVRFARYYLALAGHHPGG